MKRITIEITEELPQELMEVIGFASLFNYVEKLEILHIYRYDDNNLIALQKYKFNMKYKPDDLLEVNDLGIRYIEQLKKEDEDEYVCFVKTKKENRFHEILSNFDFLLHYPLILTKNYIKMSIISHEDQLKALIDYFSDFVNPKKSFKVLSIMPVSDDIGSIYSNLTKKQLSVIEYATKNGYYQIPREISSEEIADKFEISVSAVHDHIRKAERKIFNILFEPTSK